MGTNYYVEVERTRKCACCGQLKPSTVLHIGKSSSGWCFALHYEPTFMLETWDDWKAFLRKRAIYDEYDRFVPYEEMVKKVEDRRRAGSNGTDEEWAAWLLRNDAIEGPNGLARASHDQVISHGEGTWDMIAGEFS